MQRYLFALNTYKNPELFSATVCPSSFRRSNRHKCKENELVHYSSNVLRIIKPISNLLRILLFISHKLLLFDNYLLPIFSSFALLLYFHNCFIPI